MTEVGTIFISKKQLVFFAKIFLVLAVLLAVGFSGFSFFSIKQVNNDVTVFDKGIAPNFSLPNLNGEKISLSDFKGKKNVLLFFNEGAGCGSCFQQIQDMQASLSEFNKLEVEVIPISTNSPSVLRLEAQSRNISMPIYFDSDLSVSKKFTALKYSMHPGKVPGHTFVLIGKDGEIKWRWDWKSGSMYIQPTDLLNYVRNALK